LWGLHTDGRGDQDDAAQAFKAWQDIIDKNMKRQENNEAPWASLVGFYYGEAILKDLD
jgi:hypothetical protein